MVVHMEHLHHLRFWKKNNETNEQKMTILNCLHKRVAVGVNYTRSPFSNNTYIDKQL